MQQELVSDNMQNKPKRMILLRAMEILDAMISNSDNQYHKNKILPTPKSWLFANLSSMSVAEKNKEIVSLLENATKCEDESSITIDAVNFPIVDAYVKKQIEKFPRTRNVRPVFGQLPHEAYKDCYSFLQTANLSQKNIWLLRVVIFFNIAKQTDNWYSTPFASIKFIAKDEGKTLIDYIISNLNANDLNKDTLDRLAVNITLPDFISEILDLMNSHIAYYMDPDKTTAFESTLQEIIAHSGDEYFDPRTINNLKKYNSRYRVARDEISEYLLNLANHMCIDFPLYDDVTDVNLLKILHVTLEYIMNKKQPNYTTASVKKAVTIIRNALSNQALQKSLLLLWENATISQGIVTYTIPANAEFEEINQLITAQAAEIAAMSSPIHTASENEVTSFVREKFPYDTEEKKWWIMESVIMFNIESRIHDNTARAEHWKRKIDFIAKGEHILVSRKIVDFIMKKSGSNTDEGEIVKIECFTDRTSMYVENELMHCTQSAMPKSTKSKSKDNGGRKTLEADIVERIYTLVDNIFMEMPSITPNIKQITGNILRILVTHKILIKFDGDPKLRMKPTAGLDGDYEETGEMIGAATWPAYNINGYVNAINILLLSEPQTRLRRPLLLPLPGGPVSLAYST